MTPKDLVLNQLQSSKWLYDTFIADFSDEEARFMPKNCNHLNWILAHLAVSEDSIISKLSGRPQQLAESLHKDYAGGSTCRADDGMTLAEARKLYDESNRRTAEYVKSFDDSRYGDKAPEGMPPLFPTAGSVLGLLGTHPFWHFGQLTVIRNLLGKPRLLMG